MLRLANFLGGVVCLALFFLSFSAEAALCFGSRLAPSVTAIDFGTVNLGENNTVQMTIRYNRPYVMEDGVCVCNCDTPDVAQVSISSSNPYFSLSKTSMSLTPGEQETINITFQPGSEAVFSDTVTFWVTNVIGGGNLVGWNKVSTAVVSVAGIGYQPKPNIDVSQTSIDFGDSQVGVQQTQNLTIYNQGDTTLSVSSIGTSSPFSVSLTNFSVAAGNQRTLSVRYTPNARGPHSDAITINSNDPDTGTLGVSVDGTGVAPYLKVTPTSHDYGTIPVGDNVSQLFTIENQNWTNSGTLNLSSFGMSGSSYSYSPVGDTSIEPGEQTTVELTFAPGSTGTKNGTFSFNTNDPSNATESISLTGAAAIPWINPSTLDLDYGDVHIGTTGTRTLNISNSGPGTLVISSFSTPGGTVSVSPTSASITSGSSRNFSVYFSPSGHAELNDDLIVNSNDPAISNLAVNLTGRGTSPEVNTTASVDFGSVLLNPGNPAAAGTQTIDIDIGNIGDETLQVTNVTCTNSAFVPLDTSASVAENESGIIQVRYKPKSAGIANAQLKINSNDADTPVRTINLSGEGVTNLDLSVSGVEVTQSIQDESNNLRMVAGKKTVVRAYPEIALTGGVGPDDVVQNVDGLLRVYRSGDEVVGSPFQSQNGPITAHATTDRATTDHSLNFVVPPHVTDCDGCTAVPYQFVVEINPASGARVPRIAETNVTNNVEEGAAQFYDNYVPTVFYIPITGTNLSGSLVQPMPSESQMLEGPELFKKVFPVKGLNYIRRPPLAYVWMSDMYNLLRGLFVAAHLGVDAPPDRTYGWLSSGLGGVVGYAQWIPGRVAIGRHDGNADGAQSTFAHELGHTYGLCHTHLSVENECPVSYDDGHLPEDGTIYEVGFDTETMKARRPVPEGQWLSCANQYSQRYDCCEAQGSCVGCIVPSCLGSGYVDLMSYTGNANYYRWIHPKRWKRLFNSLRDLNSDPAHAVSCLTKDCNSLIEPVVLVSGAVGKFGDQELAPLYFADSIPDQPSDELVTDYSLRLVNDEGTVLLEYPLAAEAGKIQEEGDEAEDRFSFSVAAPALAGMHKIQIIQDGAVIQERVKSPHAPTLGILEPTGGENYTDILTVRWLAEDEDKDKLLFAVAFSPDGGQTFRTLGVDIGKSEFEYDVSQLPGSSQAIVRVIVTDGFNSQTVDSALFSVASKPPQIKILEPETGGSIISGATVSLRAAAYDLEDGPVVAAAVSWNSSIQGSLGMGNPLAKVLVEGEHIVTARVQDSDGNSSEAQVTVHVVSATQAPRANAGEDQSINEGDSVTLDASASMDPNQDLLSFAWQQLSGPTVTLDDAQLDQPVFTAPGVTVDTQLRFRVHVSDGSHTSGDEVSVTVRNSSFAKLELSERRLKYGVVGLGDAQSRRFTIHNGGNESLEISKIGTSRAVFTVSPRQLTLQPGASTEVTVEFAPADEARYEALLWIESNTKAAMSAIVLEAETPNFEVTYIDHGGASLPSVQAIASVSSGIPGTEAIDPTAAPEPIIPIRFGGSGCSLIRAAK